MSNTYVRRKISHPVGFWHWKDVWMVAKAPRKYASSRSRRACHEDWFINLFVHFSVFQAQCYSPVVMASMQPWAFGASRSCLRSSETDLEKQLEGFADDNG